MVIGYNRRKFYHKFVCKINHFIIFAKENKDDMRDTQKKYYKIGEVAEILDIPASTLRFWEKEFTIIKPKRNASNIRYYSLDDIETIRMVYYLVKEKGLKLDAAQQQIKQNRSNVSKRHEVVERLKEIREELRRMEEALNQLM